MLRLLLVVVIATISVQAAEVKIKYASPVLEFTLPNSSRGIGGVVFNYIIGDETYKARGVKTSEGWQFQTRDVNLAGVDTVYANAVVYDVNGNIRTTTPRSSLTLGGGLSVLQLPSRRIRGAVIWRDDFNGNTLDMSKWKYEVSAYGGYHDEFQVYTNDPKNVYLRDGRLYIQPTLTVADPRFNEYKLHHGIMDINALYGYCTFSTLNGCYWDAEKLGILPPIMSGKIMSIPTLKYGTVEVRAKIPKGDWLWPAIWLLSEKWNYGQPPRSGEIDMMESTGNEGFWGNQRVSSTLHWGSDPDNNRFRTTQEYAITKTGSWPDAFHTWRLDWTPDRIVTYIDNQKMLDIAPPNGGFWEMGKFSGPNIWKNGGKMAPYDKEFYLILNVAVGGIDAMFNDWPTQPWKNSSPRAKAMEDFWNARNKWLPTWQGEQAAMHVDYVEFRHL